MKNIIVTDQPDQWNFLEGKVDIVSNNDYLNIDYANTKNQYRVINLCSSYDYQNLGYYVSLIAEARRHKVYPSILNIQDINQKMNSIFTNNELLEKINTLLKPIISNKFTLSIYFGRNIAKKYDEICKKLHGLLPLPLFKVDFCKSKKGVWSINKIATINISDIPKECLDFLQERANEFVKVKRLSTPKKSASVFDLAILVNSKEEFPPSNEKAIKNFIDASNELNVSVQLIEKSDYQFLTQYDGLFIRETTYVDNHTYNFARKASAEGLIVIDDPRSILKCGNKVYLHELLHTNHFHTPNTAILYKSSLKDYLKIAKYPCVLKQPDSCFSKGIVKINNEKELIENATKLFKKSELLLIQDYIPTAYDWRIGILDNKPLYACRYFMAKDHWQIYNWDNKDEPEGEFDCVPIEKVPKNVIAAAVRASKLIGNSLYGVDIKEYNNKAIIIEINDNPSIDAGVEDQLLGKTIYLKIIQHFIDSMKKIKGYT